MNKNLRKMMACLLTAAEVLTLMPVNAAAAQDTDIQLSIDSGITVDPGITIDDSIPVISSESADKENETELLSDNEEDDRAKTGTGSITMCTEWHDDGQTGSDELLEGYLNQLVEENKYEGKKHIEPEGIARGELLDIKINKYMYDFLAPKIKKVADGSLSSSEFSTGTVNMSDIGVTKTTFTKEELGVSDFNSQENRKKALSKLIADSGFSTSKIMNALLEDLPYDLYWYDKTESGTVSFLYGCGFSYSESSISVSDLYFVIKFYVSKEYSSTGAFETTDINTQKTGAAKAAVTKAKAVVADAITAGNNTDYKKMQYYKDYICDNVSYNYDALEEGTPYGNPWQLIWVFDDDPYTKVVCEGYSKAFKLFCDLSDFDYSDADCYLVSGTMSGQGGSGAGAHMWNVVHMDDGKNYLVDVTNCDTGFSLFLAGYKSQITNGYVVDGLTYTYDSNTLRDFSLSERTINSIDYKESQTLIDISGATVTLGNSLTYNGQIQIQTVSKVTVNGTDLSSSDYTVSNSTGKNAGNYTLTVTARTGSAYTGSVTKGFTIGKKAVNPTVTVTGSYTYTGSAVKPAFTVLDGNTALAESDYTASLSNNTNAGSGSITVKATSTGNYSFSDVTQSFTINKAAERSLADVTVSQTYTNTSISASVAGKMPANAGTVSYTKGNPSVVGSATVSSFGVTTAGNVNATFSNGKAGDVITLPVTISSTNYNDSIIKVVVTLKAKSSANVSISGSSSVTKTYGDGSFTLSASALNKGSGQGIWTWSSSNTNTATVTNTSGTGTVTIKGVGQSTIKAHYESDTTVGEASVTLTVNKKTLTLTWNDTSFTYDGSAHKPTATLSGVKSGDVCTVSVSGEQANAGTYTATASLSGAASGNYALQNNQKTCSFTINKASISGAAVTLGTELTYTGSEQTQTVSKVTVNGKELASTDYTVTNNKGTNAGSYNLTVTAAGNNYTGSKTQVFIISKKSITPTVTISGTYTFTGSAITPSYTVKDGNTALAATDYTATLSDNTNAGTGKLKVSERTTGNYSFSDATQNFTINKAAEWSLADVTVSQTYTNTSISASVAGKMPENAGTVSYRNGNPGVVGSATVSSFSVTTAGNVNATFSNGKAGDVITLPVKIGSTNYKDSIVKVVVTLTSKSAANVSIAGSSTVTKTYGDESFTLSASAAVPGTGTGKWTWESSNANVATVAGSGTTGTITIKGVGQSILKAHYESDTTVGEAFVTINVGMKTLELNWSNTSFTYDGAPHKPTATVTGVISGDDCTVSVSGEQTEAGTHTATASLTGAASGNYALQDDQKTCAFTISKIKVSNLNITGAVNPVSIRKGDEIQLGVMVTPSYASDKTVKWSSSNTNAVTVNSTGLVTAAAIGTAVITAEANDGSGVSATLNITVFDDNDMLYVEFADGPDYMYTGKPVTPLIRVYNRGRLLMQETDYTVKYSNNVNANYGSNEKKAPKAVVTGKTVAATAEAVFHIYPKDIGDETSVLAEEVNISSGMTAAPLLYYGGTKLGTKDFTNPDAKTKFTESCDITVTGTGNFTGERTVRINVKEAAELKSVPKIKVQSFNPAKKSYNGQPQKIGKDEIVVISASDKNKEKTRLEMDKDFYIAYPDDITNAGTVKISIIGKGEYTGAVGKSYKIEPAKNADVEIEFPDKESDTPINGETYDSFAYRPGGVKPLVNVFVRYGKEDRIQLTAGRDYKVAYKNNVKAGAANKNKPATATVTFLGNYKSLGKKTREFFIDQADLKDASIIIPDKIITKVPSKYPLSAPIIDIDGITVAKNEYTVTYFDENGKEITSKDKITETQRSVPVKVKIDARKDKNGSYIGNYKISESGAPEGKYLITYLSKEDAVKDLSKATVIIQKKDDGNHKAVTQLGYTGKPIEIGKGEYSDYSLYVFMGKKTDITELSEKYFTVSYSNNINAGKATVSINGSGNGMYYGSKTFTFKIVKGKMRWVR